MNVRDVQSKIDVVTENLANLNMLPTATYEEFISDFRNTTSALHLLQTSIQALADIAGYVVSCLGLRTPATTVDVVMVLHEEGLVSGDRAETYVKMIQFRNRVVHLYNRIDSRLLYDIVSAELADIGAFLGRLLELIESNPD